MLKKMAKSLRFISKSWQSYIPNPFNIFLLSWYFFPLFFPQVQRKIKYQLQKHWVFYLHDCSARIPGAAFSAELETLNFHDFYSWFLTSISLKAFFITELKCYPTHSGMSKRPCWLGIFCSFCWSLFCLQCFFILSNNFID